MTEKIREAAVQLRIDLDDPKATLRDATGRVRRVQGLRIDYGRRSDGVVRTDVVVEYTDAARHVTPSENHPAWLVELVNRNRPDFLSRVTVVVPVREGMGSFPTPKGL